MTIFRTLTLAACAVVASIATAQTGQSQITVVVDGNPIVFPNQQPAESEGRVLVPLRGVFEKLGASVEWDPATQSILARTRRTKVKLAIGQLDASVNDQPVHMDVPATLVGATTMVPLRFVSEALGAFVGWNPANHEVDIKSKVDYDIPKGHERDHDHDRDRQPAPPVRPAPPMRPTPQPPRQDWFILGADSIIPFVLQTRLNSGNAQVGDQFTANLDTSGRRDYFGLPASSIAYGSVSYVRPQHGRDPGVIELTFDHIMLPNGRNLPLNGRLFDAHGWGNHSMPNGPMMADSTPRHDHTMFTGYGAGIGLIVGVATKRPLEDALIGGLIGSAIRPEKRNIKPSNVELRPGTKVAFRLYSDLKIPRR